MNWTAGLAWLSTLNPDQEALDVDEPDRADMGTAFGLDASMSTEYAAALPGAPEPTVWERRLAGRSRL